VVVLLLLLLLLFLLRCVPLLLPVCIVLLVTQLVFLTPSVLLAGDAFA
jgi:hypothetical protein